MRVGILVECGRDGLEVVVVRRICDLLRADGGEPVEIDIVPMDNKNNLIQQCGPAVAGLLAEGCDRVVILWDERPAWPRAGERLCWHNDRQDILANLERANVTQDSVFLVCIEREFETWLLYDHRMISAVLSTNAHMIRVGPQRNPDRMKNPKATMTSLFRQHRGWRYMDIQHARSFANQLTDLSKLRRCATFQRFAEKLISRPLR